MMEQRKSQEGGGASLRNRKYGTIASRVEEARQEVNTQEQTQQKWSTSGAQRSKKTSPRDLVSLNGNGSQKSPRQLPPRPEKLPPQPSGGRRDVRNAENGTETNGAADEHAGVTNYERDDGQDGLIPSLESWMQTPNDEGESYDDANVWEGQQHYSSRSESVQHKQQQQYMEQHYYEYGEGDETGKIEEQAGYSSGEATSHTHEQAAAFYGSSTSEMKAGMRNTESPDSMQRAHGDINGCNGDSISDARVEGQDNDTIQRNKDRNGFGSSAIEDSPHRGKGNNESRRINEDGFGSNAIEDGKVKDETQSVTAVAELNDDEKDDDDKSSYNSEVYSIHSPEKLYSSTDANLMQQDLGNDSIAAAVKSAIQTLGMLERLLTNSKDEYPEFTSALSKASTLKGLLNANPNSKELQKEFIQAVQTAYDHSHDVELSPEKSSMAIRRDPAEKQFEFFVAETEEDDKLFDIETLRKLLESLLTAAEHISLYFDPNFVIMDDEIKKRLAALRKAKEVFSEFLQERRQRKPEYAYTQKDVQDCIFAGFACLHDHLSEVARKWYKLFDNKGTEDGIGPRALLKMAKTVSSCTLDGEKRAKLLITLEKSFGKTADTALKAMLLKGVERLEAQDLYVTLSGYVDVVLSLLAELEYHSGRSFKLTDSNQRGLFAPAWREFHSCANGLCATALAAIVLANTNTKAGWKSQLRALRQALVNLERKYGIALQVFQECLRRKFEEEARRKRAEEVVDEEASIRGKLKRYEKQIEDILKKAKAVTYKHQKEPVSGTESPRTGKPSTATMNANEAKQIEDMCFDAQLEANEGWRLADKVRFQLPEDTATLQPETYVPLPPDLSSQPREAIDLEALQTFSSHVQTLVRQLFDLERAWQRAVEAAEREQQAEEERKKQLNQPLERVVYRYPSLPAIRTTVSPTQTEHGTQTPSQNGNHTDGKKPSKKSFGFKDNKKQPKRRKKFTLPITEECKGHKSAAVVLIDQPRLHSYRKERPCVDALIDCGLNVGQALALDRFDHNSASILQLESNRLAAHLRSLLAVYRNILNFTRVIYRASKKSLKRARLVKALSDSTKALKTADSSVPGLFMASNPVQVSVQKMIIFEGNVRRAEMDVVALINAYESIIGHRMTASEKRQPRSVRSEGGSPARSSSSLSGDSPRRAKPLRYSMPDQSDLAEKPGHSTDNIQGHDRVVPTRPAQSGIGFQQPSPRTKRSFSEQAVNGGGNKDANPPAPNRLPHSPRNDASATAANGANSINQRGLNGENLSQGFGSDGKEADKSPRWQNGGTGAQPKRQGSPLKNDGKDGDRSPRSQSGGDGTKPERQRSGRTPSRSSGKEGDESPRWQREGAVGEHGRKESGKTPSKNDRKDEEEEESPRWQKKGVQWKKDDGSNWQNRHKGLTIDAGKSLNPKKNGDKSDPLLLKEEAGWHNVESFNKSKGIHHVSSRSQLLPRKKSKSSHGQS